MKVEFEFESSCEGKLTIDGKSMDIKVMPGWTELGCSEADEDTLGGIFAREIYGRLAGLMQASAIADEGQPNVGVWDKLPEEVAEAVERRISSW